MYMYLYVYVFVHIWDCHVEVSVPDHLAHCSQVCGKAIHCGRSAYPVYFEPESKKKKEGEGLKPTIPF